MRLLLIAGAALLCAVLSTPAQSTGVDVHGFTGATAQSHSKQAVAVHQRDRHIARRSGVRRVGKALADPRPRAWCGWWLRQQMGVADRSYNLARKWAQIGTAAHGPAPGVIAVWPHHVGLVTGVPGPGRIVLKSGNDGRAVRERERSTRGIIAYRWPPGARVAMQ